MKELTLTHVLYQVHQTHPRNMIVSFWIKPLVVGGNDGRLYLAICGNTVGLWAEGEQGRGIAGARELELGQVVDEEVQSCGH